MLAPEHPLVDAITAPDAQPAVNAYRPEVARRDLVDRQKTDKEKTGVFTGGYAINPANRARIPIWIADYVLMGYGTGAIMAVPGTTPATSNSPSLRPAHCASHRRAG